MSHNTRVTTVTSPAGIAGWAVVAAAIYVVELGVAAALCGLLFYIAIHVGFVDFFPRVLSTLCSWTFGWIVVSALPMCRRFKPRGVNVTPYEQSRLLERVNKVAALLGTSPPEEVYVVAEMDATAYRRGGCMRLGSKRGITIGLPLLHVLTVSEFDAAVARELAQFRAGWLGLIGLWMRYMLCFMDGTVLMLTPRKNSDWWAKTLIVPRVFAAFRDLFRRAAAPILQAEVMMLDRRAATAIGSEIYADGIRRLNRYAGHFSHYFYDEVQPAVYRGLHPPLMDGFDVYLKHVKPTSGQAGDAGDTDPSIVERLAAIRQIPAGAPNDCLPAISLLMDVPDTEAQVLLAYASSNTERLRPITWNQAVHGVLQGWRFECRLEARALNGLTLGRLRATVASLDEFAQSLWLGRSATSAKTLLAQALGCALFREGWWIDHAPGYVRMRCGHAEIDPHEIIEKMTCSEFTHEIWQEILTEFDLDPAIALSVPGY